MAVRKEKKIGRKKVIKKSTKTKAKKRVPKIKQVKETSVEKVITTNEQEAKVQVTKYDLGERKKVQEQPVSVPVSKVEEVSELPSTYGETKIALLVRDPFWVYTYWEIDSATIESIKNELKDRFNNAKKILRVYDVTDIQFDGSNAHSYFDIELTLEANNWYIKVPASARSYCVEIGFLTTDNYFKPVARSNIVATPRETVSDVIDEEWMIVDKDFEKIYQLSGGVSSGMSSIDFKRQLAARLAKEISSGAVSSISSFSRVQEKPKKFWLVVDTELIVYGATESDAEVTIQGRPVKLRPDGSFSLRFALPDGKQIIDVKAVSKDKNSQKIITPIISRKTI